MQRPTARCLKHLKVINQDPFYLQKNIFSENIFQRNKLGTLVAPEFRLYMLTGPLSVRI